MKGVSRKGSASRHYGAPLGCKFFAGGERDIHFLFAFFIIGTQNRCVDHNSNISFQKPNLGPSLASTVTCPNYKKMIPLGVGHKNKAPSLDLDPGFGLGPHLP